MMDSLSLEEENIIRDKRNPFRLKEGLNYTVNKEIRNIFKREKKNRDIKHGILIDLFEHEKEEKNCYKHVSAKNFGVTIILNTKVTVIEIEHFQLKNIFIKLDHI